MKKLLLILLCLPIIGFGQDTSKVKLTREGLNPINIQIKNKTKSDIHSKVIKWVNNTYLSPEKVIIANTNDAIRIRAFVEKGVSVFNPQRTLYDYYYLLNIEINDNSLTFNMELNDILTDGFTMPWKVKSFFKKKGDAKKSFRLGIKEIENNFKILLQGIIDNLNSAMTREEAIAKLKEGKDLLDLGLINQEEYEILKKELSPLIMNK